MRGGDALAPSQDQFVPSVEMHDGLVIAEERVGAHQRDHVVSGAVVVHVLGAKRMRNLVSDPSSDPRTNCGMTLSHRAYRH
jgi:hypothetical protein